MSASAGAAGAAAGHEAAAAAAALASPGHPLAATADAVGAAGGITPLSAIPVVKTLLDTQAAQRQLEARYVAQHAQLRRHLATLVAHVQGFRDDAAPVPSTPRLAGDGVGVDPSQTDLPGAAAAESFSTSAFKLRDDVLPTLAGLPQQRRHWVDGIATHRMAPPTTDRPPPLYGPRHDRLRARMLAAAVRPAGPRSIGAMCAQSVAETERDAPSESDDDPEMSDPDDGGDGDDAVAREIDETDCVALAYAAAEESLAAAMIDAQLVKTRWETYAAQDPRKAAARKELFVRHLAVLHTRMAQLQQLLPSPPPPRLDPDGDGGDSDGGQNNNNNSDNDNHQPSGTSVSGRAYRSPSGPEMARQPSLSARRRRGGGGDAVTTMTTHAAQPRLSPDHLLFLAAWAAEETAATSRRIRLGLHRCAALGQLGLRETFYQIQHAAAQQPPSPPLPRKDGFAQAFPTQLLQLLRHFAVEAAPHVDEGHPLAYEVEALLGQRYSALQTLPASNATGPPLDSGLLPPWLQCGRRPDAAHAEAAFLANHADLDMELLAEYFTVVLPETDVQRRITAAIRRMTVSGQIETAAAASAAHDAAASATAGGAATALASAAGATVNGGSTPSAAAAAATASSGAATAASASASAAPTPLLSPHTIRAFVELRFLKLLETRQSLHSFLNYMISVKRRLRSDVCSARPPAGRQGRRHEMTVTLRDAADLAFPPTGGPSSGAHAAGGSGGGGGAALSMPSGANAASTSGAGPPDADPADAGLATRSGSGGGGSGAAVSSSAAAAAAAATPAATPFATAVTPPDELLQQLKMAAYRTAADPRASHGGAARFPEPLLAEDRRVVTDWHAAVHAAADAHHEHPAPLVYETAAPALETLEFDVMRVLTCAMAKHHSVPSMTLVQQTKNRIQELTAASAAHPAVQRVTQAWDAMTLHNPALDAAALLLAGMEAECRYQREKALLVETLMHLWEHVVAPDAREALAAYLEDVMVSRPVFDLACDPGAVFARWRTATQAVQAQQRLVHDLVAAVTRQSGVAAAPLPPSSMSTLPGGHLCRLHTFSPEEPILRRVPELRDVMHVLTCAQTVQQQWIQLATRGATPRPRSALAPTAAAPAGATIASTTTLSATANPSAGAAAAATATAAAAAAMASQASFDPALMETHLWQAFRGILLDDDDGATRLAVTCPVDPELAPAAAAFSHEEHMQNSAWILTASSAPPPAAASSASRPSPSMDHGSPPLRTRLVGSVVRQIQVMLLFDRAHQNSQWQKAYIDTCKGLGATTTPPLRLSPLNWTSILKASPSAGREGASAASGGAPRDSEAALHHDSGGGGGWSMHHDPEEEEDDDNVDGMMAGSGDPSSRGTVLAGAGGATAARHGRRGGAAAETLAVPLYSDELAVPELTGLMQPAADVAAWLESGGPQAHAQAVVLEHLEGRLLAAAVAIHHMLLFATFDLATPVMVTTAMKGKLVATLGRHTLPAQAPSGIYYSALVQQHGVLKRVFRRALVMSWQSLVRGAGADPHFDRDRCKRDHVAWYLENMHALAEAFEVRAALIRVPAAFQRDAHGTLWGKALFKWPSATSQTAAGSPRARAKPPAGHATAATDPLTPYDTEIAPETLDFSVTQRDPATGARTIVSKPHVTTFWSIPDLAMLTLVASDVVVPPIMDNAFAARQRLVDAGSYRELAALSALVWETVGDVVAHCRRAACYRAGAAGAGTSAAARDARHDEMVLSALSLVKAQLGRFAQWTLFYDASQHGRGSAALHISHLIRFWRRQRDVWRTRIQFYHDFSVYHLLMDTDEVRRAAAGPAASVPLRPWLAIARARRLFDEAYTLADAHFSDVDKTWQMDLQELRASRDAAMERHLLLGTDDVADAMAAAASSETVAAPGAGGATSILMSGIGRGRRPGLLPANASRRPSRGAARGMSGRRRSDTSADGVGEDLGWPLSDHWPVDVAPDIVMAERCRHYMDLLHRLINLRLAFAARLTLDAADAPAEFDRAVVAQHYQQLVLAPLVEAMIAQQSQTTATIASGAIDSELAADSAESNALRMLLNQRCPLQLFVRLPGLTIVRFATFAAMQYHALHGWLSHAFTWRRVLVQEAVLHDVSQLLAVHRLALPNGDGVAYRPNDPEALLSAASTSRSLASSLHLNEPARLDPHGAHHRHHPQPAHASVLNALRAHVDGADLDALLAPLAQLRRDLAPYLTSDADADAGATATATAVDRLLLEALQRLSEAFGRRVQSLQRQHADVQDRLVQLGYDRTTAALHDAVRRHDAGEAVHREALLMAFAKAQSILMENAVLQRELAVERETKRADERVIRNRVALEYEDLVRELVVQIHQLQTRFTTFRVELYHQVMHLFAEAKKTAFTEKFQQRMATPHETRVAAMLARSAESDARVAQLLAENGTLKTTLAAMQSHHLVQEGTTRRPLDRQIAQLAAANVDAKAQLWNHMRESEARIRHLQASTTKLQRDLLVKEADVERLRGLLKTEQRKLRQYTESAGGSGSGSTDPYEMAAASLWLGPDGPHLGRGGLGAAGAVANAAATSSMATVAAAVAAAATSPDAAMAHMGRLLRDLQEKVQLYEAQDTDQLMRERDAALQDAAALRHELQSLRKPSAGSMPLTTTPSFATTGGHDGAESAAAQRGGPLSTGSAFRPSAHAAYTAAGPESAPLRRAMSAAPRARRPPSPPRYAAANAANAVLRASASRSSLRPAAARTVLPRLYADVGGAAGADADADADHDAAAAAAAEAEAEAESHRSGANVGWSLQDDAGLPTARERPWTAGWEGPRRRGVPGPKRSSPLYQRTHPQSRLMRQWD